MSPALREASSSAYPSLERKKGKKDNWVERAGGLPSYIERIAKHLHYEKGHSISSAIAMAVNTVKRWAKGTNHNGGKLKPATVTKAAAAVASWTAKKGKNAAKKLKESHGEITATPDELADLLAKEQSRLTLLEGVSTMLSDDPRQLAVANARSLFGSRGESMKLEEATAPADPAEVKRLLERVNSERAELEPFIEMLGGEPLEEARGEKVKTKLPTREKVMANEDKKSATRTKHLQRRMSSLGFESKDDGAFGPKTEAEVKAFQRHAGLKEDGVVGEKTTKALKSAPTPEDMESADAEDAAAANGAAREKAGAAKDADATRPAVGKEKDDGTMYKGMGVGDKPEKKVRTLQLEIEELGYPNIDVDGRFGPKTEKTVKSFQRKMGLKSDGIVGPKTKKTMKGLSKKLNEAIDRRQAADPNDFPAAIAAERQIRQQIAEGTSKADTKDSGIAGGGAMKRCPSCGWKMKSGTTKCGKCGAELRKKGDANAGKSSD